MGRQLPGEHHHHHFTFEQRVPLRLGHDVHHLPGAASRHGAGRDAAAVGLYAMCGGECELLVSAKKGRGASKRLAMTTMPLECVNMALQHFSLQQHEH